MSEVTLEKPCLFSDNSLLVQQGIEVLRGISPSDFSKADAICLGGSVGGHVRHCIEFYRCFLDGLTTGRLDYDARARDVRLETDLVSAREALMETVSRLDETAAHQDPKARLLVIENHDDSEPAWSSSSVSRELRFLLSHTVHHYALIAILLRVRGMDTPQGFGIAPSTLRHRARETCAP